MSEEQKEPTWLDLNALRRQRHGEYLEILKDELNVKEIEILRLEEAKYWVDFKLSPNFKAIGEKFRSDVPQIKEALKTADPKQIQQEFDVNGEAKLTLLSGKIISLSPKEVNIELVCKDVPGFVGAVGKSGACFLDTRLTPGLVREGIVNELIHEINDLRKSLKIPFENRIGMRIICGKDVVDGVIENADKALSETLSKEITLAFDSKKKDDEFQLEMIDWGRNTECKPSKQ